MSPESMSIAIVRAASAVQESRAARQFAFVWIAGFLFVSAMLA